MSGFFVKEIPNTNIVVGPYPLYEIDVNKIAATGAQAVINLQTPAEIEQRGQSQNQINGFYRANNIHSVNYIPIDDSSSESLEKGLFEAATSLNTLINEKKLRVYIHCTSSLTRAPSAIITYLCLYLKHSDWI